MDSMRSLNSSLPRSGGRRRNQRGQSTADLLQAFRTAALSVTQLYKSAVADNQLAKESGYQEALKDVLAFLDRENIGLGDGEGWRVRQWATERLSPDSFGIDGDVNETDEEETQSKEVQHSSVTTQSSTTSSQVPNAAIVGETPTVENDSKENQASFVPAAALDHAAPTTVPPQTVFSFQASGPQVNFSGMELDDAHAQATSSRVAQRHGSRRNASTSSRDPVNSISLGLLGSGAGSKRKSNFTDFFDVGDLSPKHTGGHAKRGKHL